MVKPLLDIQTLADQLTLPVIAAPMFIVSEPALVKACSAAGVIGSFPAANANRSAAGLDGWLNEIEEGAARGRAEGRYVAPFAVNIIVHKSNAHFDRDIAAVAKHKVPLIITSVGAPGDIAKEVHAYGGLVFHDVIHMRHARKAVGAGVDGLILVCAGAGGHAGTLNPFAFVTEARAEFDLPLILSGTISTGRGVRAARVLGADFAYLGTRFIATEEANADAEYKRMIFESGASDITYTPEFSGIPGSYLTKSIVASGVDPTTIALAGQKVERDYRSGTDRPKAWAVIKSGGQGVGTISDAPPVAELVARLKADYDAAGIDSRAAAE
jgi:nitronate monooxygenase